MKIKNTLLNLWKKSELISKLWKYKKPDTFEDFESKYPLACQKYLEYSGEIYNKDNLYEIVNYQEVLDFLNRIEKIEKERNYNKKNYRKKSHKKTRK